MDLIGSLIDCWRRQGLTTPRITKVRTCESASQLPTRLPRRTVTVAGSPPAWAVMECPCGTGHRLMIRIRPHQRATTWQLTDDHGITMKPSIDYITAERRCHFWLRSGRIVWVPAAGHS